MEPEWPDFDAALAFFGVEPEIEYLDAPLSNQPVTYTVRRGDETLSVEMFSSEGLVKATHAQAGRVMSSIHLRNCLAVTLEDERGLSTLIAQFSDEGRAYVRLRPDFLISIEARPW